MTKRRIFTPEFKARVVLEMITAQKSSAQASREFGIKGLSSHAGNKSSTHVLPCRVDPHYKEH